jgi:hypothetical protein
MQSAAPFREYIKERVGVQFDGVDQADGLIAEAVDEATGQVDEGVTIGNLLTIRGYGLKIEGDDEHKDEAGLFFEDGAGSVVKVGIIAVNEPKTLKVIVPAGLAIRTEYTLKVVTQSSAKGGGALLKNVREVRSDFKLVVNN